jgi:hypothetical protein
LIKTNWLFFYVFLNKNSEMKLIYGIILSILLISCGVTVSIDYDKEADFSKYKSYNFFPTIDSGLNELENKRIISISDSLLQQKGFIKSESPQFLINFYANESIANSRNTIGIGVGSGGGNVGVGVSGGIPIGGRVINQELTIDFIDATKDALFWQAKGDGDFKEKATPMQREAYYASVISKMLQKYPPKIK